MKTLEPITSALVGQFLKQFYEEDGIDTAHNIPEEELPELIEVFNLLPSNVKICFNSSFHPLSKELVIIMFTDSNDQQELWEFADALGRVTEHSVTICHEEYATIIITNTSI